MSDKSPNILVAYQPAIETAIVISVGTLLHLNSISIIEFRYSKLPILMPNAASTLVAFSLLCIFAKLRPLWTRPLRKPQQIFSFLMEMALILYGTDFLMRHFWLPSLKILSFACNLLIYYTVMIGKKLLIHQDAAFNDDWMRTEGFYFVRFIWALVVFIFMLDTTGLLEFLQEKFKKNKSQWPINDNANFDDNLNAEEENTPLLENLLKDDIDSQYSDDENEDETCIPFDVKELSYAPQDDFLDNDNNPAAARRPRKMMRKSKRNNKVTINNPDKECFC